MTDQLFSDRSIWTMVHGIVFSGGALMALAAALFALVVMRTGPGDTIVPVRQADSLAWLLTFSAVLLWAAVIMGTYLVFPLYRAAPPPGAADLAAHPRALLLRAAETAWLHSFAMETKEHMPWIAAMLATAVAFVGRRARATLLGDAVLRSMVITLLVICFTVVSFAGILGIFINKAAPLQ